MLVTRRPRSPRPQQDPLRHAPPVGTPVTRRRVLGGGLLLALGAGGGMTVMACSRSTSTGGTPSEETSEAPGQVDAVAMFSTVGVVSAGVAQRLPIALLGGSVWLEEDTAEIPVTIRLDGSQITSTSVTGHVAAHDHPDEPGPHPHGDTLRYYPLRATFPEPGIYDVELTVGPETVSMPIQVFEPSEVTVLGPGDRLPAVPSPTVTDPRQVDPLCTLAGGPCPLHTRTLEEAVTGSQGPIAVLVASPAYCTNSFCASMLRVLIDLTADRPELTAIHVEPYADPRSGEDPDLLDLTRAETASDLGLSFEPSLFVADSGGQIVERFDAVVNRAELETGIDRAT